MLVFGMTQSFGQFGDKIIQSLQSYLREESLCRMLKCFLLKYVSTEEDQN